MLHSENVSNVFLQKQLLMYYLLIYLPWQNNNLNEDHTLLFHFFYWLDSVCCCLRILPLALREVRSSRGSHLWWISCEIPDIPGRSHTIWPQHKCDRTGREGVCFFYCLALFFFFVLTPKVVTNLVFALQVQQAVQALINQHQQIPGNILRALLERFHTTHKDQ